VTHMPDLTSQPTDGTEALQDGWVASPKNMRKSASAFEQQGQDSPAESKPWDSLKDGWDKHK
jgi:hypothetical protein